MSYAACQHLQGRACGLNLLHDPSAMACAKTCKSYAPVAVTLAPKPQATPAEIAAAKLKRFRSLWREMHTHVVWSGSAAWLAAFAERIPCGTCRAHWKQLVTANPPDLSSQDAFDAWAVARHNDVNASLNRPAVTLADARERWHPTPKPAGATRTMFFTRDNKPANLLDRFLGASAFLICGGPSFATVDKTPLTRPGVVTMGYNNVVKVFRPNLWCAVDDPSHFLTSIWRDPRIEKFVPRDLAKRSIYDTQTKTPLPMTVEQCPNTWLFRRNETFNAATFLTEETLNWGDSDKSGGTRTGMLIALRVLHLLGFRTIYLLGVDFEMSPAKKYAFDQDRTVTSIKNNLRTYAKMIERFTALRPIFEAAGLNVFNCNPASKLRAFDFVDYGDAIRAATRTMPDVASEQTAGLYELQGQKVA